MDGYLSEGAGSCNPYRCGEGIEKEEENRSQFFDGPKKKAREQNYNQENDLSVRQRVNATQRPAAWTQALRPSEARAWWVVAEQYSKKKRVSAQERGNF